MPGREKPSASDIIMASVIEHTDPPGYTYERLTVSGVTPCQWCPTVAVAFFVWRQEWWHQQMGVATCERHAGVWEAALTGAGYTMPNNHPTSEQP